MTRYEYQISSHPVAEFRKLVYLCGEGGGQCKASEVPDTEFAALGDLLNQRGADGWELVQMQFGAEALVLFWKRQVIA